MIIDKPYYEDMSRISNSNIGWFLNKGPAFLYRMLTGKEQCETGSQLDRGTMIHEYLLQPEEFFKDYQLCTFQKPASTQQEEFCKYVANSVEIEPNKTLLSAFKQAYKVGNQKDEEILRKASEMASTLKEYIEFLSEKTQKKLMSQYEYQNLKKIKENVENHKLAKLLVNPIIDESIKVNHEFHINWQWKSNDLKVDCKSLLDSCLFDFKNKQCIIMDLKTTVKIGHFEDSVNLYDYTRQLMFYTMAVKWYIRNEINEDPDTWIFNWYIVAIDTTGTNEIRVFQFTKEQIYKSEKTINNALTELNWHISNNVWEHHKEYYDGDGSEKINL